MLGLSQRPFQMLQPRLLLNSPCDPSSKTPSKPTLNLWLIGHRRKKYAKMKVKFELGIRENETLIREELRIEDLSKRIQEQNEYVLRSPRALHSGWSLSHRQSTPRGATRVQR